MAQIGSVGVAAFALVQYVLMLGAVFFNALGTGSQPVVSQNYGAGRGLLFPLVALAVFPSLWQLNGIWLVPIATELAGAAVTWALLTRWSMTRRVASCTGSLAVGIEHA